MSEPVVITRECPSSVEIHRDAKGTVSWTVKCYGPVGEEEATALQAIHVEEILCDMFGEPKR